MLILPQLHKIFFETSSYMKCYFIDDLHQCPPSYGHVTGELICETFKPKMIHNEKYKHGVYVIINR